MTFAAAAVVFREQVNQVLFPLLSRGRLAFRRHHRRRPASVL